MKGYKIFIGIGALLLVLYLVAELNRPEPINWDVTLSKGDKNPYGSFVLYDQLKNLFSQAEIKSYREPWYNRLHDNDFTNSAYINLAPELGTADLDITDACKYVEQGNYMLLSSYKIDKKLLDTLGLKIATSQDLLPKDSTSLNFTNPQLKAAKNYTFKKFTINEYFSKTNKKDSTIILGINNDNKPNFVKVNCGKGAFFVHAAPLCFSNYFMLHQNNSDYTAKVLSYIPKTVNSVMWDEYYKLGRSGPTTPLRFFLSNTFLRWALWLSIIGLVVFVLIERKRKQRIIPEIPPLRNTTLDFINTVASVYYDQRDNKGIAQKKLQYWTEFVRQRFYLSTQTLDKKFIEQLSKKSGVEEKLIKRIVNYISVIQFDTNTTDVMLTDINNTIDSFYKIAK